MALGAVPGSVRAIIMAQMPALARAGVGANAMIRHFADLPHLYRRQQMLTDYRKFTGLARLERAVQGVAANVIFPRHAMLDIEYRSARRYYIQGRMTLKDMETGELSEEWVSFFDNTRKSKDQWTRDFIGQYAGKKYKEGYLIEDVKVASVMHQRGWAF